MRWTTEQRAILDHPLGAHAVVRAVPGAGKTTTLVGRVQRLLEQGAPPERVRVVMFNRSIQQTFVARLQAAGIDGVRVTTFDALGLEVLRVASRQGLLSRPLEVVADGTTQWAREVYRSFREDFDSPAAIADAVAFWKAHLVPPARAAYPSNTALVSAYQAVEDLRLAGGTLRVAFEDMVYTAVGVLGRHPRLLGPIDHWLIDEFQDVNPGRVALLQRLLGPDTALLAVGDEDQGINEWCGAHPAYFRDFAATFPNLPTATYPLSRSFRFGPVLAQAASALIAHNGGRPAGSIRGAGATEGTLHAVDDVPDTVARLLEEGWAPGDIAILYRGRPQGAAVLATLAAARVPMHTDDIGILRQGRGPELALGYLRAATARSPLSAEEVWPVVCAPDRYIQKEAFFTQMRALGRHGFLAAIAEGGEAWGQNRGGHRALLHLAELLPRMAALPTAGEALDLLLAEVDVEAQLRGWLKSAGEQEMAISAFHATHQLLRGLEVAPRDAAAAVANLDPRCGAAPEDCLWVSTIHKAKGLEWRCVLLPGLVEGACPAEAVGRVPGTTEHPNGVPQSPWMDQERRIFYVGLTRAIDAAFLHAPGEAASRFVAECQGRAWLPPGAALTARERAVAVTTRSKEPRPASTGRSWSEDEDEALIDGWEEGQNVTDLSEALERSRSAIAARLVRLGLVESRAAARRRG